MNVVVWVLQGLLALAFLIAGVLKISQPKAKLAPNMPWVEDFSVGVIKLIGAMELLAAVGLILPGALDIAPVLTPLAAVGLVVLMLLAAATHARRKEPSNVAINGVLLALAAVVAWARFGPYSF